jgi:hypothetical protein
MAPAASFSSHFSPAFFCETLGDHFFVMMSPRLVADSRLLLGIGESLIAFIFALLGCESFIFISERQLEI